MGFPNHAEVKEDGTVLAAKDWLGNRIALGDLVMYCIGAGHGQMMAFGRIKYLRFPKHGYQQVWDEDKRGWRPCLDDERQVEVQVMTEGTSGNWNNDKRTKPAWVNPMNITAIRGVEDALRKLGS